MHDEVEEQLSLAEECLKEAKLLLTNGFYRGAASRAYYSMFHAAKALLALKNIAPKKHSGVLRMLGLEFVNKGIWKANTSTHMATNITFFHTKLSQMK